MGTAVPATAPGRTGRAVQDRGNRSTAPAHSPAGYEPEKLDQHIMDYLTVCERSVKMAEKLAARAMLAVENLEKQQLQGGAASLQEADDLTKLHERLTKANLNTVKSLDELTRLRSFLAGGPDSRTDYTAASEVELRVMFLTLAPKLGFKVEAIDAEVVA